MLERVQRSKLIDEVMVITSIERENLPILKLCADLGVRVGVGSENDVLDRFYQTAKLLAPQYVIRLTADCPCFDPSLLDSAISELRPSTDYLGMRSESFADGLDIEIIRFTALKRAWQEATHTFEREHVTQYIIRHPDLFTIQDFVSPIGYFGNQRWTVDEPEDFELVRHIYEHFFYEENKPDFDYRDILSYLEKHPEISGLNKKFKRNEGLEKSIKEDLLLKENEI